MLVNMPRKNKLLSKNEYVVCLNNKRQRDSRLKFNTYSANSLMDSDLSPKMVMQKYRYLPWILEQK